MGKLINQTLLAGLLALTLSGCVVGAAVGALGSVATAAISAVGGVLAERAFNLADAKKVSLTTDMEHALAAVQKTLHLMNFEVQILQPTREGGYIAIFGNKKNDGSIALERETEKLTTFKVKVLSGDRLSRREEVENAVSNLVGNIAKELPEKARFDFHHYNIIRKAPNRRAARIGWFRIGSRLPVHPSASPGWLKISMPEGEQGYLKGTIQPSKEHKK